MSHILKEHLKQYKTTIVTINDSCKKKTFIIDRNKGKSKLPAMTKKNKYQRNKHHIKSSLFHGSDDI